ncbi:MAG: HEAT repeat domain-containing protein, partial [Thainema sp.]
AAYALGALGDSAAVQPLINILKDSGEDTSLRGDAASALGAIADSAAVQPLINILKDSGEDASLRRDAASALGAIGKDAKDAIPSLRSALQDLNADAEHLELKDISTAWASILVDDGNIEELVSLLKDPTSKYVRAAAALGLTELGQEAEVTVSDLRERLRSDPDPQVRENVILALGTLGLIGNEAKSAVPELLNALINKGTRVAAALALGVIAAEPDRVVPALMQALKKTRSWPEFEDITLAFRSMRTEAKRFVPDLINTIENANNDNAVRAAIYALAAIGPGAQAAVWPLIELKKKLPFCEETCIDALVEIDSGSAIPFLLSLDLSLGSNPGDHIGKILDKISSTAISALIQYLKAPDLRIRRNVAFALAYTKLPEGVLPLLLDVVRNDDEDIEIRRLIAYGLERTGQDVEDFFAHNHLVPMSRAVCLTRSGIFGTYIGTCEVGWGEGGGIDWFQSLRDYLRRK